jgi:hypothetical protein
VSKINSVNSLVRHIKPKCAAGGAQPVKEDAASGTGTTLDKSLIGGAIVKAVRCVFYGQARRSCETPARA